MWRWSADEASAPSARTLFRDAEDSSGRALSDNISADNAATRAFLDSFQSFFDEPGEPLNLVVLSGDGLLWLALNYLRRVLSAADVARLRLALWKELLRLHLHEGEPRAEDASEVLLTQPSPPQQPCFHARTYLKCGFNQLS